jgi:hypothetical protein
VSQQIASQSEVGVRAEAEQARAAGPQVEDLLGDGAGVVLVV